MKCGDSSGKKTINTIIINDFQKKIDCLISKMRLNEKTDGWCPLAEYRKFARAANRQWSDFIFEIPRKCVNIHNFCWLSLCHIYQVRQQMAPSYAFPFKTIEWFILQ